MSSDFEETPQLAAPPEARSPDARSPVGRGLLFAGVAAACALGVGAGMWARPAAHERPAARAHAKAPAAAARSANALQIVVDDRPAAVGQPLEVMPAASAPAAGQSAGPPAEFNLEDVTALPAVPAAEMAPRPAPNGLLRVQAIAQPPVEAAPAPAPAPASKAVAPKPVAKAVVDPAATRVTEKRRPKAEPAKPKLVAAVNKVAPKPAKATKADAPAAKAKSDRSAVVARENADLRARLLKAEARLAKAERSARPKLAAAVKALKTSARAARPEPKPTKARAVLARPAKRAPAPVVRPVAEPRLTKIVARRPQPTPKAAPVKVAKAQGRCASADAAQAMVCRDPSLGAADRELGRAYRQAEAAGVPSWRLAQQQQRWAAARANAAREAPWAVRDVYQAQIAQLRDMSQHAGSDN